MRVDNHAYKNKKGKIINPFLQKENKIYKELMNSKFIEEINFKGNILIIARTELPSELDHNYKLYYKNFNKVIEKHIKNIYLYKKNHPNFKIVFFLYLMNHLHILKQRGKLITKKIGMNVKGNIHFWFLDKKFIDYYNNEKIQKSLGYLTPMQFKQKQLEKQKVLQ